MHNITTNESGRIYRLDIADVGGQRGASFRLNNGGDTIAVRAYSPGATGAAASPNQGWGCIAGEDLFALREFLAELPEEAFTRPADPVEVPRWTDGDVVVAWNSDIVWSRKGGVWNLPHGVSGSRDVDDNTMTSLTQTDAIGGPWTIIRQQTA